MALLDAFPSRRRRRRSERQWPRSQQHGCVRPLPRPRPRICFAYADRQGGLHLALDHRRPGIPARLLSRQSHGYMLDGCPISAHILRFSSYPPNFTITFCATMVCFARVDGTSLSCGPYDYVVTLNISAARISFAPMNTLEVVGGAGRSSRQPQAWRSSFEPVRWDYWVTNNDSHSRSNMDLSLHEQQCHRICFDFNHRRDRLAPLSAAAASVGDAKQRSGAPHLPTRVASAWVSLHETSNWSACGE